MAKKGVIGKQLAEFLHEFDSPGRRPMEVIYKPKAAARIERSGT
jgi:hypothetical protein